MLPWYCSMEVSWLSLYSLQVPVLLTEHIKDLQHQAQLWILLTLPLMVTLARVRRLNPMDRKTGLKSTWRSSMTSMLYFAWAVKVEIALTHSLPNLYNFSLAQTNLQNFVNFYFHIGIFPGWLIKRHILCMWLTNLINSTITRATAFGFWYELRSPRATVSDF